jgi:hypothetical protein
MNRTAVQSDAASLFVYKAVISLNNDGVSMVAQGYDADAALTFKAAMHLLNWYFFKPRGWTEESTSTDSLCDVNEALRRAAQRRALHSKNTASGGDCGSSSNNQYTSVAVLSANGCGSPLQVYYDIAAGVHLDNMFHYSLRFDNEDEDLLPGAALDFEAGVLLYNLGVALCMHATKLLCCGQSCAAAAAFSDSLRVHLLSESVVRNLFVGGGAPTPTPVLLLSLLVTNSIVEVADTLEMYGISDKFQNALSALLLLLKEHEFLEMWHGCPSSTAGAA